MNKMLKILLVFALALFIYGCGNQFDSVKNAYLTGREQTTIGNAFDTFFTDTNWELKEAENKTRFVEFKGIVKKDSAIYVGTSQIYGTPEYWNITKGTQIIVQFILKADGTFYIGYFGTKDYGINEDQINGALNAIYGG